MLSPSHVQARIAQAMSRVGSTITLHWVEMDGAELDPTSGSLLGAATAQSEEVSGFVFYIAPVTSEVRLFQELSVGDALLDLPTGTVLAGRDQLEFEVDGQRWVQKKVSNKLLEAWDVLHGNQRLCLTVAVTLKR